MYMTTMLRVFQFSIQVLSHVLTMLNVCFSTSNLLRMSDVLMRMSYFFANTMLNQNNEQQRKQSGLPGNARHVPQDPYPAQLL